MKKALAVGAMVLAVAGLAAALPVGVGNELNYAGKGMPGVDGIVKMLGFVPTEVSITNGGMTKVVPWDVFVSEIGKTSFGGTPGVDGPVASSRCSARAVNVYCGPDVGAGTLNAGPFCDNSSNWVIYTANTGGLAYTEKTPGVGPTAPICGGFFGPTVFWEALEMSNSKDPDVLASVSESGYEGCYSTKWQIHSDTYCPNPFSTGGGIGSGGFDTYVLQWRAHGQGVAAILGFGTGQFDYFLGNGATTGYDLPAGALGSP